MRLPRVSEEEKEAALAAMRAAVWIPLPPLPLRVIEPE